MNTLDDDGRVRDVDGGMDALVQVILGFFLIVAFGALSWLMVGAH
jgi:hypothetical protein